MAFNEELYKKIISTTNEQLVSGTDSTFSVSETKMKEFLEQNTDITDTDKAKIYADFLTNITTTSLQQTLNNAQTIVLENDFKEAQTATETQKVISMKAEDDVRKAQSDKDLLVKDAQISTETQKVISMKAEDEDRARETTQKIASMIEQDKARNAEVASLVAKTKIEVEQKIPAEIDALKAEAELKKQEAKLKETQLQLERARTRLTERQIEIESARLEILRGELDLKREMNQIEIEKMKFFKNESAGKIALMEADMYLKQAQTGAVSTSIATNLDIEREKMRTQIEVATIYVKGGR